MGSIFTRRVIYVVKDVRELATTGMSVRLADMVDALGKMMIESVTRATSGMWSSRERMHIIRISWRIFGLVIFGVGHSSFMRMKMIWDTGLLKIVLRLDTRGHALDVRSLDECNGRM